MHGEGSYVLGTGDKYEGWFVRNMYEGFGVMR